MRASVARSVPGPSSGPKASGSIGPLAAARVQAALSAPGRPLDPGTQAVFGARLQFDFSKVRVHTDDQAAAAASALRASAFTVGHHVAMPPGALRRDTSAGWRLLGHELVHVVQQGAASPFVADPVLAPEVEEREADRAAEALVVGRPPSIRSRSGPRIARQAPPEAAAAPVAELPFTRYVDQFEEVVYDQNYLPERQGAWSPWLRVSYADGTMIDISVNEFSETAMPLAEAGRAMAEATVGRGDRIFPRELNPSTTPRLFAARRSVVEIMEQQTLEIATVSAGTVIFVITATTPLLSMAAEGPPTVTATLRKAVPPPKPPPVPKPPAAAPLTETAEQIGTAIGKAVSGNITGKMAAIVEQVTARRLSQADAVKAIEAAVHVWLKTGPRVLLADGSIVVTSVKRGLQQPMLVVRPDGSAYRALADLVFDEATLTVTVRNVIPAP